MIKSSIARRLGDVDLDSLKADIWHKMKRSYLVSSFMNNYCSYHHTLKPKIDF